MIYDLESRTINFSKDILDFVENSKISFLNKNIIDQLLRSATSIGANYREANNGASKKDFINKINICRKEAKETEYWIELLAKVEKDKIFELRRLWSEAHQLTLILGKISYNARN